MSKLQHPRYAKIKTRTTILYWTTQLYVDSYSDNVNVKEQIEGFMNDFYQIDQIFYQIKKNPFNLEYNKHKIVLCYMSP